MVVAITVMMDVVTAVFTTLLIAMMMAVVWWTGPISASRGTTAAKSTPSSGK